MEVSNMLMTRDAQTVAELDAISRRRVLTDAESRELERAVRRTERLRGRVTQPWLPKHDAMLRRMVLRRKRVAEIAQELGRTENAVWVRLKRLRAEGKVGYFSQEGGRGRYRR